MKLTQMAAPFFRLVMALAIMSNLLVPAMPAIADTSAAPQAVAWMTQNVLSAQGATPLSIVVDRAGVIHIAYYSSTNLWGLHHAWFAGAVWQDELIENTSGSAVDIALGGDQQLFILYDNNDSAIKLATYNGVAWSTSVVTQTVALQPKEYGSLAVDDDGALHVSFFNKVNQSLYYGVRAVDTWKFTKVQSSAGRYTSIGIDNLGYPHISFCGVNDLCAGLRHAFYNGSDWNITNITASMGSGSYTQLAFDLDGRPVIAAYETTNQTVKLFRKDAGGVWGASIIQTSVGSGGPLGLGIDAAGAIHLAYYLESSGDLRYALYSSGLTTETAASTNNVGARPALAFGLDGKPLIAHQDSTNVLLLTSQTLGVDLQVTDIWNSAGKLSFQILNAGLSPVSAVYYARLIVDSVQIGSDILLNPLAPGERQTVNMDSAYACSGGSDTIEVRADVTNVLAESDEANNTRSETWRCDPSTPVITGGPAVSNVNATSATVTWTTDVASDSFVGLVTRKGEAQAWIGTSTIWATNHSVNLTGLSPNTTYEAVVRSQKKGSGPLVLSRMFYFTTLPSAFTPPGGKGSSVTRSSRQYESYDLVSEVTNPANVARMDFFMDGVFVGSDYTPNVLGQYEFEYVPAAKGVARSAWFGGGGVHTMSSTAVLLNGATVQQASPFNVLGESMEMALEINQPSDGYEIFTPGDAMPAGAVLPVSLFAEDYEWGCSAYGGGGPADPDASPALCSDMAGPVAHLKLYLNDALVKTFTTSTDTYFTHNLSVANLPVGRHKLSAVATATDGSEKTVTIYFYVVKKDVGVLVTHSGFTEGAHVVIDMTITNPSTSLYPVTINKVYETAHGLQWASQTLPYGTLSGEYDPATRNSWITLQRTSLNTINPGQSLVMRYKLAPILYEDMQNVSYWLNQGRMTVVDYTIQGFNQLVGVPSELAVLTTPGGVTTFSMAINMMMKNADYLIVTNPAQLIANFDDAKVKTLLSKMAELAITKQGVLGYLDTYDDGSILNNLIAENSSWLSRLNDVFEDLVDGYVLLVGDLRIIASDRSMSLYMPMLGSDDYRRVHHTDNMYAQTQGDGRPDLVVGRLIGTIDTMLTTLQTSLDVYNGAGGRLFNKTDGSFVSGSEPHEFMFEDSVEELGDTAADYSRAHNELYFDYQSALWYYDFNYEEFDGVAACDVNGDGKDELVHGDRSANKIVIYNPTNGAVIGFLVQNFEEGDGLACGDVDNDGIDEIVHGDRADKIYLFDYHTGGFNVFNWDFMAYDQLAVGNVVDANPGDEIVMADRDDYIYVLSISGAVLLTLNLNNYTPDIDFMEGDKIAVGDVSSLVAGYEIVITSRADDQVIVLTSTGLLHRLPRDIEYGDDLAVGSVATSIGGGDEIIIGDRNNYITVYDITWNADAGDYTLRSLRSIHSDFEMNDRITPARVKASDASTTIIEFMRDDQISALDSAFPAHGLDTLYSNMATINADLLIYRGHGSGSSWSDVMDASQVRSFGSLAPVVAGITCQSGNYPGLEDLNMAASVLKHGAGLYIGATENSVADYNNEAAPMFLTRFYSTRPAAADWTHLERQFWGYDDTYDYYAYFVYEYNIYGDPKFGKVGPTLVTAASAPEGIAMPAAGQVVDIPDYVRTDLDGVSRFSIPDNAVYTLDGEPVVPTYLATFDYPAGTLVQNVTLAGQTLSETLTGVTLPIFDAAAIDGSRAASLATANLAPTAGAEAGWLPEMDQPFTWQVTENSNGSSTLEILIYPMQYAPATLMARFYNQLTFNITTASTSISITDLRTAQARYSLNAPVTINMVVENSGAAQDMSVVAEIRRSRSTDALSSVPFDLITGLSGEGHYAAVWDSNGLESGQYTLEVRLYNSSSQLVAQSFYDFNLGQSRLAVQHLASSTQNFTPGATVNITFDVTNTGEEALAGTAYVTVNGPSGYSLTLSQPLSLLNPGNSQPFTFAWNTTGVPSGQFTVNAFVSYESRTSAAQSLELANGHKLFLPFVKK